MAGNTNQFFVQQFASNVELVAQQMRPRIASTFAPMTAVGKAATVVNLIDPFEADERTGRYDDIIFGEPNHKRPWVYPRHFDKALPIDNIELMQMLADPKGDYVMGIVAALNRRMDDEAIRAFFADRNMGEDGSTVDSFAAARQISVDIGGTGSGLNLEKIQEARKQARKLEVGLNDTNGAPTEVFHCVITPQQEQNLMNEIEVISSDFTVKRILDAGTMVGSNYAGIDWIISNRLLTDGNGYRRVPFYTSMGMTFCTWDGGIKTDVSQRKDKRGLPWQAYGEGHFGAVRRDDVRVFEIKCAES